MQSEHTLTFSERELMDLIAILRIYLRRNFAGKSVPRPLRQLETKLTQPYA